MKQLVISYSDSVQNSEAIKQLPNAPHLTPIQQRPTISTNALRRICCILLSITALFCISNTAHAARIFIPELEMFTSASLFDNGRLGPSVETAANLSISIEADNKIGGQIELAHVGSIGDTFVVGGQQFNQLLNITLISMSTGIPFETPFYVEFFSGNQDTIGGGESFDRIFNIDRIYSSFTGLQYSPIDAQIEGLHQIRGTGLVFASEFDTDTFSGRLYLYRESPITDISGTEEDPIYTTVDYQPLSSDLRIMYHEDTFAADFYFGFTYRASEIEGSNLVRPYFLYSLRTGVMIAIGINQDIELYTYFGIPFIGMTKQFTIGLPSNNATGDINFTTSLSNFQFVLEPRFSLDDSFGLHFSIVSKPFYYSNDLYTDPGLEINTRIFAGSFRPGVTRGGISLRTSFLSNFSFEGLDIIPFLGTTGGGVEWDLSTNLRAIPLTFNDFAENFTISIGARTAF